MCVCGIKVYVHDFWCGTSFCYCRKRGRKETWNIFWFCQKLNFIHYKGIIVHFHLYFFLKCLLHVIAQMFNVYFCFLKIKYIKLSVIYGAGKCTNFYHKINADFLLSSFNVWHYFYHTSVKTAAHFRNVFHHTKWVTVHM